MTRSPRSGSGWATFVLVIAVVAAAIAACSDSGPNSAGTGAPGRGVYIESAWQTARGISGHRVHVVDKKIACVKCHAITNDSIGTVTPGRCAGCHTKESRIEHASDQARARFGANSKADCTACHAFTLEGTGHPAAPGGTQHVPFAADCGRCHSSQQGDTPAVAVHGTSDCVTCHRPHEDGRPQPGPCTDCHKDVSTTHAAHARTATEVCTTCHEHQHAPASAALATCTECHAKHEPKVPASALFADGHKECVGCHRPHAFESGEAVGCQSCHEGIHVLAAPRVREHSRCTSCHAPHDVRGTAEKACATCHADVHSNHPKHGAAGSCVGCHDPHPAGGHALADARDCSGCHQTAASDSEFHNGVACEQCHAPHAFVLEASDRTVCKACHAEELGKAAGLPGHAACKGCHGGLPHRPTRLQVGCQGCHAATHAAADAGHKQCTNCHEPHGGALVKDCKSCHADEHRTAPAGHRACTSCHEQHSGSTARVSCSTCHTKEAQSTHGRLGKSCNDCHRPHGPQGVATPPSCGTCHQSAKLSGLHRVKEHRACASCHTGHGDTPGAARSGCLNCHQDRKDHFPNATSCASCHLFGPTR